MFCPLCQAEYRDGVTECSDCHVALVSSLGAAHSSPRRLWQGNRQRTLDKVLAALDAQNIPSYFEEVVNKTQATFLGLPLTRFKSTFEYEVWVLSVDLERTRDTIAGLKTERASSVLDAMNWQAIAKRLRQAFGGSSQPSSGKR